MTEKDSSAPLLPCPVAIDELPEAVIDAVAAALGDAYDCLRVWSAWSYGTMGPDDFGLVSEDGERTAEIARAAIEAYFAVTAVHCTTCNDQGAVGNILTAEPCPDCSTPAQAVAAQAAPAAVAVSAEKLASLVEELRMLAAVQEPEYPNFQIIIEEAVKVLEGATPALPATEDSSAGDLAEVQVADAMSREERMIVLQRNADGTPTVWCDPEIADIVRALNSGGVKTLASCSGHGEKPGGIALADGRQLLLLESLEAFTSALDAISGEAEAQAEPVSLPDAAYTALQFVEGQLAAIANRQFQNVDVLEPVDTISKAAKRAKAALLRLQSVAHHFDTAPQAQPQKDSNQ